MKDECPALDHKFNLEELFDIRDVEELAEKLNDEDGMVRKLLENHVLEVTKVNKLYAHEHYLDKVT